MSEDESKAVELVSGKRTSEHASLDSNDTTPAKIADSKTDTVVKTEIEIEATKPEIDDDKTSNGDVTSTTPAPHTAPTTADDDVEAISNGEPELKKVKLEEQEQSAPPQQAEQEEQKHEVHEISNGTTNHNSSTTPITNNNNNNNHIINVNNKTIVVPATKPHLFYSPLKTGLVYDVRMRYHAKIFTSYFEYIDPHPEDPRRIYRIYKKLAEAGLIQDPTLSGIDDIGPLMVKIPIREATAEEILEVHSEEHLKFIQSTETMTRDQLMEETEKGDSIYVNNDSYYSAKLSCGGTIEACKAVIEGRVKNSLAVVRPPGHHAEPDTPGGFCLFSNVAVAAKNILKNYSESVRKIVIVDWDVHHGNGTQKSFYNDRRVLYISIHVYDNGKFYPGTKYGNLDQVGEGEGEGFNINIPWRSHGMHDGDYIYAFNKVVLPIINEFNPDLTIISSGFDAADGDIIGACHVTPAGYGTMTHMLKGIGRGKLAVILEGGYNLESTSKSALGVAKVLVGEPPEDTISLQPHLEAIEIMDEVIKTQSKYWKSLKYGLPNTTFEDVYDLKEGDGYKVVNIGDPIRSNQYNELFNRYSFINLPIITSSIDNNEKNGLFTTDLPAHLEDIIIASPDIYDSSIAVLTIHDPPEIWANINPINGNTEGNSSIVLEYPLHQIIEKVKKESEGSENPEKIGYIDINIPSYQLPIPSGSASVGPNSNYNPTIFAQELLLYVWDNYFSYFSNLKKIVFVGFGEAYQAIVHLYAKRPSQEIKDLVKGTVVYLNRSSLKPVVPVMDESMVDWYYQNSVIFTSCLNPVWVGTNGQSRLGNGNVEANGADDSSKRPRRKFGRVIKASVDGLYDVINERFDEGIDFILDSIEDFSSSESSN
ncbi:histone deacetylase HDA1 [Scheffersomyces coipomensis]|uniref:histone deacetylase HDA1 n=1 Tax=Scheffersomyces coipomensis TaxID=1788519 RepID=UPI00315DEB65